ncbi:hypothetical protein BOTCAL_0607g00060 [Botryotinia calthae]|uniref:Uncharacterized protein n=1 Tax=Botryotinia calthae TaxID=38488 RepID=A0A4Y8CIQ0_9HELO|nr:hypothetical protein BOTCAL_0607g00060 [Botryotinia calthae]
MTSSVVLCCLATSIPRGHSSNLLSLFLSALDARLRLNKAFPLLAGDIPTKSEPIIELQSIEKDRNTYPKYHMRYFLLTDDLEKHRPYIEMYPGDSFGELEIQAVVQWKKEQKQWWSMDNITDERSVERKRRMNDEMEGEEHLPGLTRESFPQYVVGIRDNDTLGASLNATFFFTITIMLSLDTYSLPTHWDGSEPKLPARFTDGLWTCSKGGRESQGNRIFLM